MIDEQVLKNPQREVIDELSQRDSTIKNALAYGDYANLTYEQTLISIIYIQHKLIEIMEKQAIEARNLAGPVAVIFTH